MDRTGNASQVESQAIVGLAVQQRSINRPFFSGQSGCWGEGGAKVFTQPCKCLQKCGSFSRKNIFIVFCPPRRSKNSNVGDFLA